jgi:hypothetical protein
MCDIEAMQQVGMGRLHLDGDDSCSQLLVCVPRLVASPRCLNRDGSAMLMSQ